MPIPGGAIWETFDLKRGRRVVSMGRVGQPDRLITRDAWYFASDATADALYLPIVTDFGDDGVWRFPFDAGAPKRVLPPLPNAFVRELSVMSLAVSDDGTEIAREFATGDLDMGGSDWVVQVRNGGADWQESFRHVLDFTVSGELVVVLPRGPLAVYNLDSRRLRRDVPQDLLEYPQRSPNGRFVATWSRDTVTIADEDTGATASYPIPELELRRWWLTNDALVLEEQTADDAYPTGVGRHLVMDLRTGWHTLFDPIAPPVS